MPRFDYSEFMSDMLRAINEPRSESAAQTPTPDFLQVMEQRKRQEVERYFADNPDKHHAVRINPFSGEPVEIFERLEIEGANREGPPQLSLAFLNYLQTEMKFNPEWREHYG